MNSNAAHCRKSLSARPLFFCLRTFLLLLLCLPVTACASGTFGQDDFGLNLGSRDFRVADWGTSKEEVQKREKAQPLSFKPIPAALSFGGKSADEIRYAASYSGANMTIRYIFEDEKLHEGQYLLHVIGKESFEPLEALAAKCKDALTRQYGAPLSARDDVETSAIVIGSIFPTFKVKPVIFDGTGSKEISREILRQKMIESMKDGKGTQLSTDNAFGHIYTWDTEKTRIDMEVIMLPVVQSGYFWLTVYQK